MVTEYTYRYPLGSSVVKAVPIQSVMTISVTTVSVMTISVVLVLPGIEVLDGEGGGCIAAGEDGREAEWAAWVAPFHGHGIVAS